MSYDFMPPRERRQRLLRQSLEIPVDANGRCLVCKHRPKWIEWTVLVGYDHQGNEKNEKLRWPGPPCQHILAVIDKWVEQGLIEDDPDFEVGPAVRKWARKLHGLDPLLYFPPPPPITHMECLDQESRVAEMATREERGHALRHPADADPRNLRAAIRERRDGTVEVLADTEPGRTLVRHNISPALLGAFQALATRFRRVRLICSTERITYSVAMEDASPRDWQRAVLRIYPEEFGRETSDGSIDDDV